MTHHLWGGHQPQAGALICSKGQGLTRWVGVAGAGRREFVGAEGPRGWALADRGGGVGGSEITGLSRQPWGQVQSPAEAPPALHIVLLSSLSRNAPPHLPASGFLEVPFFMTHRWDTSCLGKRGGRNLRM